MTDESLEAAARRAAIQFVKSPERQTFEDTDEAKAQFKHWSDSVEVLTNWQISTFAPRESALRARIAELELELELANIRESIHHQTDRALTEEEKKWLDYAKRRSEGTLREGESPDSFRP